MDDQHDEEGRTLPSRSQRHQHKTKPPKKSSTASTVRIRPVLAVILLIMLMFIGAVTGSTVMSTWQ